MKNDGLKQANMLARWLDMNDVAINDVVVTMSLKNGDIYKIMSDGSVMIISDDHSKAFANANEAILSIESKHAKKSKDAIYKIVVKQKK